MGLRGCISIECLPLQILLKANPSWTRTPVAVTKEERPQSPILALNTEAREKGLSVGMRYSNALSLVPGLRARAVAPERIAEARDQVVRIVSAFTPDIELCSFDTDALWASVDGLRSLFGTEAHWSREVRKSLAAGGFTSIVVIGFTRYGTYAAARSRARSMVFASEEEERALVARSPVDILPLPQKNKSALRKLEIRTVRQFVSLPEGEITRRFGKEAGALWRALRSEDRLPVQALAAKDTAASCRHLDAPLSDLTLLMPHIQELLAVEAARAEAARSVISGLTLTIRTEDGRVTTDLVRPAAPTLRMALLERLIALRLASRQLSSGVEQIEIRSAHAQPSRTQAELFCAGGRDLQAGARTFAALRARFGNDAVTRAQLRESYLPELSFRWVPMQRPVLPRVRSAGGPPGLSTVVRRILFTPRQCPQRSVKPVSASGTFVVSGSWWGSEERNPPYHREYSFDSSSDGVLWIYRDRQNDTTWIQGAVD